MNIEINGIETFYLSEGSGETIVMLHGWGCNCEIYRNIINHLAVNYNAIILDLPGFGKTHEPPVPWGVGEYSGFVIAFLKKLGLSEFILFGHSLGGRLIIKMLSDDEYKFKTQRVILTGSAGIKPKRGFVSKVKNRIYKIGRFTLSLKVIKKFFPDTLENLRRKNGSPDYNNASPIMRQCLVKIVNEDLTPLLAKIKQSVLLIWGEIDDQTPLSDGQLMEKEMPDAGLAVIKGAGHYAFLERFDIFSGILDAFLLN